MMSSKLSLYCYLVSQPSLDQSGRGSLSSGYYENGSSKEPQGPQYGHTQPRPQHQEPISHPVITNNSPALVAQALSGEEPCQALVAHT